MNQIQVKYAKQRLEELFKQKTRDLRIKFSDVGVTLSVVDKLQALRDGRYTIKDYKRATSPLNSRLDWAHEIVFTDERPSSFDTEGHRKATDQLTAKYHAAMDELILGDNRTAHKLIKEFEAV